MWQARQMEEIQYGSILNKIRYGSILQHSGEKPMLFFGERYLSCWQERGGGWAWHDHEYAVTRPYYTMCKIFYLVILSKYTLSLVIGMQHCNSQC